VIVEEFIMEQIVDQERLLDEGEIANIDLHYTFNSDDLRLARGIFNGFIVELFAAAFVYVIIVMI
jgi:hypothetical protein